MTWLTLASSYFRAFWKKQKKKFLAFLSLLKRFWLNSFEENFEQYCILSFGKRVASLNCVCVCVCVISIMLCTFFTDENGLHTYSLLYTQVSEAHIWHILFFTKWFFGKYTRLYQKPVHKRQWKAKKNKKMLWRAWVSERKVINM